MQVSSRTLSYPNTHQIGAPIERPDRQMSPFGPLGMEKGLGGLAELARVSERSHESRGDDHGPVDDYQTGRLAKQARQEQAKEQWSLAQGDKAQSLTQTLEKVFGVTGIKQFSATYAFDYKQTFDYSSREQLAYTQSSSGRQGINYDYQESYRSVSKTAMAMSGTLTLEDGRSFAFSIDYSMERSIEQQTNLHVGINAPSISVSAVGNSTSKAVNPPIEIAGSNRAFTVLPSAIGNGSYEGIAEHDDNGNGYIDKNDSIWSLLSLGMGNEENSETLANWRIAIINLIRLELPYISKEEETPPAANQVASLVQAASEPLKTAPPINVMA